jgi:hypothetical protein
MKTKDTIFVLIKIYNIFHLNQPIMIILLLTTMLGVVSTQIALNGSASSSTPGFPKECYAILNSSSGDNYPVTSIANAFNTFCE